MSLALSGAVPLIFGPPPNSYPLGTSITIQTALYQVVMSLSAGLMEEVLIVALPVTLRRSVGQPWKLIVPVLIILRVSFHVYYGYGSLGLIIWAFVAIALYCRYRSAVPLILMHTLQNAFALTHLI